MLQFDIGALQEGIAALRGPDQNAAAAQRQFDVASRFACHAALTAAAHYPGVLDRELATRLEKLFTQGLKALDETQAPAELMRNVSARFDKLKPLIRQARRNDSVSKLRTRPLLACDWPALDGRRYLGGTMGRDEIYGDAGR